MHKVRKHILSLDGGGFRGLSSLVILDHLMRMLVDDPDEDPIPSPCQIFDLICGTSTGGLIAILLGRLGLDCATAISVYKELGPRVFSTDDGKVPHILGGEKFSSTALDEFLGRIADSYTGSQITAMKMRKSIPDSIQHSTTKVFVTTVSSETGYVCPEAYRLRSYATPRGGTEIGPPNHIWTIREAARATTATPLYFMPLRIGLQAYQDATPSGFSNPTWEAIAEAELLWPSSSHDYVIVSLGTGPGSLIHDDPIDAIGEPEVEHANLMDSFGGMTDECDFTAVADSMVDLLRHLKSVANDTELIDLQVSRRFAEWERSDDYFRLTVTRGLGDLDDVDFMSEGTIIEITNVWLRSPEGQKTTWAAYEKLRSAYEAQNN